MDPNLFHLDWDRTVEALAGIVVLAFLMERSLSLFFENRLTFDKEQSMNLTAGLSENLQGVFAVPPLARKADAKRTIDFDQNSLIVRHLIGGGITRLLYGGNAFLYHVTLAEYEQMLDWLSGFGDGLWPIPSIGPSYGRAIDQAALLRKYNFPCMMMLPCADPREFRNTKIVSSSATS